MRRSSSPVRSPTSQRAERSDLQADPELLRCRADLSHHQRSGATPAAAARSRIPTSSPLTINPVNDAPLATTKTHSSHSAIGLTINAATNTGELIEGASDVDDAANELAVELVAGSASPATMQVTLISAADGSFYVEPPGGFTGTATFQVPRL